MRLRILEIRCHMYSILHKWLFRAHLAVLLFFLKFNSFREGVPIPLALKCHRSWGKLTITFLLQNTEANIYPDINLKHFYRLLFVVIIGFKTIRQNITVKAVEMLHPCYLTFRLL